MWGGEGVDGASRMHLGISMPGTELRGRQSRRQNTARGSPCQRHGATVALLDGRIQAEAEVVCVSV